MCARGRGRGRGTCTSTSTSTSTGTGAAQVRARARARAQARAQRDVAYPGRASPRAGTPLPLCVRCQQAQQVDAACCCLLCQGWWLHIRGERAAPLIAVQQIRTRRPARARDHPRLQRHGIRRQLPDPSSSSSQCSSLSDSFRPTVRASQNRSAACLNHECENQFIPMTPGPGHFPAAGHPPARCHSTKIKM